MKCKPLPLIFAAMLALSSCSGTGAEYALPQGQAQQTVNSQINLSVDGAEVNGGGAEYRDGTLYISSPGTYTLRGTLDGGIVAEVGKEADLELVLSGVDINPDNTAAIWVKSADKIRITLADGTENIVSDGGEYAAIKGTKPSACIYSEDDLIFGGGGSLTVFAHSRNAVESENDLRIEGGSYYITAARNGIKGKDSVKISGGDIEIPVCYDGIKSDNEKEPGRGVVEISGGSIKIIAQDDGIQATSKVVITGGAAEIDAGDKRINCDVVEPPEADTDSGAAAPDSVPGGTEK